MPGRDFEGLQRKLRPFFLTAMIVKFSTSKTLSLFVQVSLLGKLKVYRQGREGGVHFLIEIRSLAKSVNNSAVHGQTTDSVTHLSSCSRGKRYA